MIDQHDELLAGLDDLDWAGMTHAYGTAQDVPGQIRALCGSDEKARKEAFNSLYSNIFHQGSRYGASPSAVPFLARIALAGPPAARADTMWLLTRLAVDWHDEYDLTTGINTAGWRAASAESSPEMLLPWYEEQLASATDTEHRATLENLRNWVAAGNSPDARWSALQCYDAVLKEIPGLLALLGDEDPDLRIRIAYLLAWFPEAAVTTVPRLLDLAAHEKDPAVAATAVLAVGLAGPRAVVVDVAPYLDSSESLTRWAAATALVRLAGIGDEPFDATLLSRAVTELAEASVGPAPERRTDYLEGDFHGHIERTLASLPSPTAVAAAVVRQAFEACLPRVAQDNMCHRTSHAIERLFPAPQPNPVPCYAELSVAQQILLAELAGHEHAWVVRSSAEYLRRLGLPDTQESLRVFIESDRTAPRSHHGDRPSAAAAEPAGFR